MEPIETIRNSFEPISSVKTIVLAVTLGLLANSNAQASLAAMSQAAGSVQLSWQAPGDDGMVGQAHQYCVRYSESPITEANWDQATNATCDAPSPAGSTESMVVTGLQPATQYFFAIKTADEADNWSALSNVVTAETPGSSLQISGVQVVGHDAHSALVSWTSSEPGTAQIHYGPSTLLGWSTPMDSGLYNIHTLRLDSLPAATRIYFRAASRDSLGIEVLSPFYQLTTDSASQPPSPITDLATNSGANNGEIDLNWTAPSDDGPDGRASYYIIMYATRVFSPIDTVGVNYLNNPPAPLAAGSPQTCTISNLELGTMYYLAMYAVDAEGNLSTFSNLDSAVATFSIVADVDDGDELLPTEFELRQNYPNPFNPTTTIEYALAQSSAVRLEIYNVAGQLVTVLADQFQSAGNYAIDWQGRDSKGNEAATGMYFYRLTTETYTSTRKMVLLK